jgi:hypothetical protein
MWAQREDGSWYCTDVEHEIWARRRAVAAEWEQGNAEVED